MKATAASVGPSPTPIAAGEIVGTEFFGGDHSVLQRLVRTPDRCYRGGL